jgi:hypothetical protein
VSSPRPLVRHLVVPIERSAAWAGLADVRTWPQWAPHIRAVSVSPPGPVGPDTSGTFDLVGAPSARFAMTEFAPPDHWSWRGRFLWLTIDYDHRFAPPPDGGGGGTTITFVVTACGRGGHVFGALFSAVYARRLDAALPRLREHLTSDAGPDRAPP